MKKIYVKPESTEVEYKFEGMIALSNPNGLHYNDKTTVDDGSTSYSGKQGWDCSQWSDEEE